MGNSCHWPNIQLPGDTYRYRKTNGVQTVATLLSLAMKALPFDGFWWSTEDLPLSHATAWFAVALG